MAVFGAAGFLDGLFHRFQDIVALDLLFAGDRIGDEQEFGAANGGIHGENPRF
jgi:hypothetical protein